MTLPFQRQLATRYATMLMLTGVFLCASCSRRDTGPPRYPVSGVLTYKGKPISDARISFTSSELHVRLAADTNPDGTFEVRTATADGLPVGEYSLTVRPAPGGDEENINMNRPEIPKRFWTAKTSDLRRSVEEGQNSIELSLSD